jgi:cytochrome c peroxidase
MRKIAWLVLFAACGGGGGGDGGTNRDTFFSDSEWAQIQLLAPLPAAPPADPTNRWADSAAAAALGQRLYMDRTLDVTPLEVGTDTNPTALGAVGDTGKVACQSCHEPQHWFSDQHSIPRDVSLGIKYAFRNDPSLVNAVFYDTFGWAGTGDGSWSFVTGPMENAVGGTRAGWAHALATRYKTDYEAIFGAMPDLSAVPAQARPAFSANEKLTPLSQGWVDAWTGMSAADRDLVNRIYSNGAKAIAAYLRKVVSTDAPFDRYVGGDNAAISTAAKRGLQLFIGKAACVACHSGPFFTDNTFHSTRVAQTGANVPMTDLGRYSVLTNYQMGLPTFSTAGDYSDDRTTGAANLAAYGFTLAPTDGDKTRFRTKSLRQIAETAPYMHDGVIADLAGIVEFYDQGGGADSDPPTRDPLIRPLGLSTQEKADLVEFMKTLTGTPVPAALLVDTSAP